MCCICLKNSGMSRTVNTRSSLLRFLHVLLVRVPQTTPLQSQLLNWIIGVCVIFHLQFFCYIFLHFILGGRGAYHSVLTIFHHQRNEVKGSTLMKFPLLPVLNGPNFWSGKKNWWSGNFLFRLDIFIFTILFSDCCCCFMIANCCWYGGSSVGRMDLQWWNECQYIGRHWYHCSSWTAVNTNTAKHVVTVWQTLYIKL